MRAFSSLEVKGYDFRIEDHGSQMGSSGWTYFRSTT